MPVESINGRGISPQNDDGYVNTSSPDIRSDMKYPTARIAANGKAPIHINAIGMQVGGRGDSCKGRFKITGEQTALFTIPKTTTANYQGRYGIDKWIPDSNGQFGTVGIAATGPIYFGRSNYSSSDIVGWPGDGNGLTLIGDFEYDECPLPPRNVQIVDYTQTSLTLSWDPPTDNGGSNLTGYRIYWSKDPSFSTVQRLDVGRETTFKIDNPPMDPGSKYYFKVAARNYVTDQYGTSGVFAGTQSIQLPSGGHIRVDGVWVLGLARVYVNGSWVDARIHVRNGGVWDEI